MNTDELAERAKDILHQGNIRRLVIRNAEGNKLVETSLTVVAAVVLLLLVTQTIVPVAVLAIIAGVVAKVRVEIVRELRADDVLEVTSNGSEKEKVDVL